MAQGYVMIAAAVPSVRLTLEVYQTSCICVRPRSANRSQTSSSLPNFLNGTERTRMLYDCGHEWAQISIKVSAFEFVAIQHNNRPELDPRVATEDCTRRSSQLSGIWCWPPALAD